MTFEIGLLLALIAVSVLFFSFEWLQPDVVALSLLIVLVLTGLLSANDAFAGFGSDAVIMILGLLILTAALLRTGVMDLAGRSLLRFTGTNPTRVQVVVMIASATVGAFMSNTASTAFFLPVVCGVAARARINPSKILLPLAFSSILSSSISLISTSTNIVVSNLMTQYKMAPMGMFELAPVGIPIAVVGLLYMLTLGNRLIPERAQQVDLPDQFGVRPYLTELLIQADSPLVGKTLDEAALGRDLDLTVLKIVREKNQYLSPHGNTLLQAGDILLVQGNQEQILKIKDIPGINIKADVKLSDPTVQDEDMALVEVILLPHSPLIRQTLKTFRFRERFGLQVLAINRHGKNIRRKISKIPLRMGDTMLVQGHKANLAAFEESAIGRILSSVKEKRPNVSHAPRAITIFLGVMVLATFKVLPLPVAVMLGAVLVFLTGCISSDEAYQEVEWKALILIGSMLALGKAMEQTGTASYLAQKLVQWVGDKDPLWILGGFFILTVALTQPMSNQAAAVVVLPVAIQSALELGLNPRSFAMMIAVAASCSYLTPLEPSCLMVYGPGRYKFIDFLKVGSILTLLIFLMALFLVPRFWPLR